MKRLLSALLVAVALGAAPSRADDWSPLLSPQALAAMMDAGAAPTVLDLRPPEGAAGYAAGHVPGAVNAPYALWRGPKDNPGAVPDDAALSALVGAAGLTPETAVALVYHGADHNEFGAAARVYWTLKSLGFERLAILNGGHAAWAAAGLPVSTVPTAPKPTTVAVRLSDRWRADQTLVAAAEAGDGDALLVDARPEVFFRGLRKHDAAAEPGTLFGAVSFVHDRWFAPKQAAMTVTEAELDRARALAAEAGDAPIVSFCNTGHWAATNWFALSELAGLPDVRLYPESVVGWSRAGLPLSPGS